MKRKTIVYCLLLGFLLAGCNDEVILHGLDELKANRVKLVLAEADIKATKLREGELWSIVVPSSKVIWALSAIEGSRILKKDLGHRRAQSSSFLPSREEQKHFFERELSKQLELTLESLAEVLEARVHVYHEEENGFLLPRSQKKESASVLIVSSNPDRIDEGEVKQLISRASGVSKEEISVIVSQGEIMAGKHRQRDVQKVGEATVPRSEDPAVRKKAVDTIPLLNNIRIKVDSKKTSFLIVCGGIVAIGVLLALLKIRWTTLAGTGTKRNIAQQLGDDILELSPGRSSARPKTSEPSSRERREC